VRQLGKSSHMNRINVEELLDRYLNKETSPEEDDLVEKWLIDQEPETTQWKQLEKPARELWVSDLRAHIELTINSSDQQPVEQTTFMLKRKPIPLWRRLASVAAILAILMALFIYWPTKQTGIDTADMTVLSVPAKQKKKIMLEDGSTVWLNSSAELRYPKQFAGKTREVFLSGEAYFDIHHDGSKPFIVHTGKVKTTVLGTAFNINTSRDFSSVVVTVTRGKVSVADQNHIIAYIIPNQQLTYNPGNRAEHKINIDAEKVIAWQGDLHFVDITFAEAAGILQKRFNVRIGFSNDKIKTCRFSGTALQGNDLDQILKVICAFNKASYQHNQDRSITIDGSGCE